MKTLDPLRKPVGAFIRSAGVDTTLCDKDLLLKNIVTISEFLTSVEAIHERCGINSVTKMHNAILATIKKNQITPYFEIYKEIVNKLNSPASRLEQQTLFGAFLYVEKALRSLLSTVYDAIDKRFDKKIELTRLKYDDLLLLGTLDYCDRFATATRCLMHGLLTELIGDKNELPPSMRVYAKQEIPHIVEIINSVVVGDKKTDVNRMLQEMKSKGFSITVWNDDGEASSWFISDETLGVETTAVVAGGISAVAKYFGKIAAVRFNDERQKLDAQKEWLDAQVSLLQQKLNGMDESSTVYKKTKEIMYRYQEMAMRISSRMKRYDNELRW